MRFQKLILLFALFFLPVTALAAPPEDLLAKLIEIAEPDQVEAYSKLNLSGEQEAQLRQKLKHVQSAELLIQWDCTRWVNDHFDLLDSSDRIHRYKENEICSKLRETT